MSNHRDRLDAGERHPIASLSRLEALGDAVFAFALTLLALDLRIPEVPADALAHGIQLLIPKLLVFVFAFLVIAQEWDVHQRTMLHIARADGIFVWLYLLSLMFVVLMPSSADTLGRYPLQPLALVLFGVNTALLCLASWGMWRYASHDRRLLKDDIDARAVKLIERLWLYPPIVILLTIPLGFVSVYPAYAIWLLMPVASYTYSVRMFRRKPSPS
jgi:uncharacterized membrane protein